uniref:T9SS type A sorting domain-containing protein n=1 Tax=Hymenobacter glacialis TaxID=1908236 RepID=UPI0013016A6C|nr:T9SS type A sorting domain-containing protein [Hymenobacter glacialis]
MTIRTSAAAGSTTTSTILDAYSGTCGNLVLLACDRTTGQGGTPAFSSLALRNLTPGSMVYIRSRVNNTVVVMTGTFNICVEGLQVTANRAALADGFLSLWPNPAQHRTQLALPALPGQAAAMVEIINSLGQTVRTQAVTLSPSGTTVELNLVDLPAGIYTVWARAGQASATVRLLID